MSIKLWEVKFLYSVYYIKWIKRNFSRGHLIGRLLREHRENTSLKRMFLKRTSLKRTSLERTSLKRTSLKRTSLKRTSLKKTSLEWMSF